MISAQHQSNRKLSAQQIIFKERMSELCRQITLANKSFKTSITIGEGAKDRIGVESYSSLLNDLTKAEVTYLRLHGYYVKRDTPRGLITISWKPR